MIIPQEFHAHVGQLASVLSPLVSVERFAKMQAILNKRSRNVVTVFENTHHAHNISAAIRNVDTFGFFDLFFVYSNPDIRFRAADAIDRGASQWLFLKRFTNIENCARQLKDKGYKIALVSLPDFSRTSKNYKSTLPSFSSSEFLTERFDEALEGDKIALVFGSELLGVSSQWIPFADMYCHVDMFGFTESLNVSVCAGILLHGLRQRFAYGGQPIFLTYKEKLLVLDYWLSRDIFGSRTFIAQKHPSLLSWFEYIAQGKFIA